MALSNLFTDNNLTLYCDTMHCRHLSGSGITDMDNVGSGVGVFKNITTSPTTAHLRSLVAGSNISVTQNTNDITIASTATPVPSGSNGDILTRSGGNPVFSKTLTNTGGTYAFNCENLNVNGSSPSVNIIHDDGAPTTANLNFYNLSEYPGTVAWQANMQTDLEWDAAGASAASAFRINSAGGSLSLNTTDILFETNNSIDFQTSDVSIKSNGSTFLTNRQSSSIIGLGEGACNAATGVNNIGIGNSSLNLVSSGTDNTACGDSSLLFATSNQNSAYGSASGFHLSSGTNNSFFGFNAGYGCTTAADCLVAGWNALNNSQTASNMVVLGDSAAASGSNTFWSNSVVIGQNCGLDCEGNNDVYIGAQTGNSVALGSDNIIISNPGVLNDNGVIRIGTAGTHNTCYISGITGTTTGGAAVTALVDGNGQLGTISSSIRFKENVKPITIADKILDFKVMEFDYIKEKGGQHSYGCIAEQVDEIMPEIVIKKDGKCETIQYHLLIPMLLDQIQKMNKRIKDLESK